METSNRLFEFATQLLSEEPKGVGAHKRVARLRTTASPSQPGGRVERGQSLS